MMQRRPTFMSGLRGFNRSYGQPYWNNGMSFGHVGRAGIGQDDPYGGEYDFGQSPADGGSGSSFATNFTSIFKPVAAFTQNIVALRTQGAQLQTSKAGTFVGGGVPLFGSPDGMSGGTLLLVGGGLLLVLAMSKGKSN